MPNPISVSAPAGYAPLTALGFVQGDESIMAVSANAPLPVMAADLPSPAPLTGIASSNTVAGPFASIPGKPIILNLTGNWSGTVRVLRSSDGGTTKLPLTAAGSSWAVFQAPCCEAVWEESAIGAELYLDIAITSGSVAYRMAQ